MWHSGVTGLDHQSGVCSAARVLYVPVVVLTVYSQHVYYTN